ncbi:MAG: caspase family protein, partial [Microcystaceae cyanobacterium]
MTMAKYALIIAIPEYDNFSSLPKTTQDGETIAQLLHNYGDYQITRLPHKGNAETADYEMTAGKVTVDGLYQTIQDFLKKVKGRPSLIYFTGHGFTVCDRLQRTSGYLATSDCRVTFKDNQIIKQENGFPLADLDYLIKDADLSELVVLLDCCHSGNYIESSLMRRSLRTFEHKQNYYLITACRSSETAKTIRKDEHSVFSGAIIKGLSDNNVNSKGEISCDRLFDSVNTEIGGKLQTPLRMGIGETIILVKHSLGVTEEVLEIEPIRDKQGDIICPYQGLNVFTAESEVFFYGRKRLTEDIKQALDNYNIIPIIGASGSGKSSVIYAGVMSWLEKMGSGFRVQGSELEGDLGNKSDDWLILGTIKPGIEPLSQLRGVFKEWVSLDEEELAEIIKDEGKGMGDIMAALPNDKRYFLFIDQFEEVFTV